MALGTISLIGFAILTFREILRAQTPFNWIFVIRDSLEAGMIMALLLGLIFGSVKLASLQTNREALLAKLEKIKSDGMRYRERTEVAAVGVEGVLNTHFSEWGLTQAERDVACLMLKGFSHKEIAGIRGASYITIRQQACAIYEKSGLANRPEFAAHFFDCFLFPVVPVESIQQTAVSVKLPALSLPSPLGAPSSPKAQVLSI
tara:strand:+ start:15218 stop:15826 length:609 start_codon:yes stop_codon:yes gene_type:complete